MSVRRGEYARLKTAGWTVTVNRLWQRLLAARVHRRWPQ